MFTTLLPKRAKRALVRILVRPAASPQPKPLPPPQRAKPWIEGVIDVPAAAAPGLGVFDRSVVCRQEHFDRPDYVYWAERLRHPPFYRRKLWEFVFICQVLHERGLLAEGKRGLGFGVGREPLAALFAAAGCEVMATDLGQEEATAKGWTTFNEHSAKKDELKWPHICDDELFDRRVSFQTFDMADTPGEFSGFDFCWSSCALEHIGSIEAGLAFIENSVRCLKPGGYAVHTTEYNLGSNRKTVEAGPTVIFRKRDLEQLARRLRRQGHEVAPFDLREGTQPLDRYVDMPPYLADPHLKLLLEGHRATSIGLIVRRGAV